MAAITLNLQRKTFFDFSNSFCCFNCIVF